jgi:phage terminase small subunit
MATGNQPRDGRTSKEELLARLAQMQDHDDESDIEKPALSEAERLARDAEPPKMRVDGRPMGSERHRKLTAAQMAFTKSLIQGKTQLESYKEAYPNSKATDKVLKTNAWRLAQDSRIKHLLNEHWSETVEVMSEDAVAVKRFVLKQLLEMSKNAKQEGSKIKALELMGKTVGLFKVQDDANDAGVSADQLKLELAHHLKLVRNIRPIQRIEPEPVERLNIIDASSQPSSPNEPLPFKQ